MTVQFLRFLLVGGFCVALNTAVYAFLIWSSWTHTFALGAAFTTSLVATYILNRAFTFRDTGKVSRSLPRVVLVYLGQLLFLWALTPAVVRLTGLSYVPAYIIVVIPAVGLTFLALRQFAFRSQS